MKNSFEKSKSPEKTKNPQKSQTELREALNKRFLGMKNITKESMEEYKKALEEGTFEDKEGEEEGSGEKRKEIMQNKINMLYLTSHLFGY